MVWLYGNLTAQAGSNLNLRNFDNYVINELGLKQYVRYVDDIVIISDNKKKLIESVPFIIKELQKTHQRISEKKTKIDIAYHGVNFLGKVSYPYGYQTSNKQVIKRTYQKAKTLVFTDKANLLAQTNSQIGTLKRYNCKKLIANYFKLLPDETKKIIQFNDIEYKFQLY